MKAFIVMSKDLFDEKKNPNFVLSAEKILENPKIKKYPITKGGEKDNESRNIRK